MQIISSQIILFIGGIGFQEVLLIALVVLLFFGGKKIPELMKGLGKGVRSFKEGMNEVEEIKDETKAESKPEKKEESKEEQ
ncbi:MAG: twin-arginine translocase TatA/TatE family subunit [Prevotella sp.]|nr:twin-arginine translocase TatA/TatE family subunit [Prevotella sp.]MDY5655729.1 twin-arginine translocase TatA/TatE family subunit [Prevotella sp.]